MSKTVFGEKAFDDWYSARYGARWPNLKRALLDPPAQVALFDGLLKAYYLDAGSVEAVSALPLENISTILDMCAAPGGKSLYIASHMPADATLVCNEYSRERKRRLQQVIEDHIPVDIRNRIVITGRDASRWSRYEQCAFDRILLDAPCSSERHVLSSSVHLAQWSPARIKNLAQRQWALLSGAWLVLKPGGSLVYATCALSYEENDGIIDRLLKKYTDVSVSSQQLSGGKGERLVHGFHVLPDTSGGSGPLYYVLLHKHSPTLDT